MAKDQTEMAFMENADEGYNGRLCIFYWIGIYTVRPFADLLCIETITSHELWMRSAHLIMLSKEKEVSAQK